MSGTRASEVTISHSCGFRTGPNAGPMAFQASEGGGIDMKDASIICQCNLSLHSPIVVLISEFQGSPVVAEWVVCQFRSRERERESGY